MKNTLYCLAFLAVQATAQNTTPVSPMDAQQYGVVLDHPGMQHVVVKPDVRFLDDAKGKLHMDVYLPPGMKKQEKRPAIVFLNGIGDDAGQPKVKSWGIYTSWPRLMAANGYIGISMESDGNRIQESLQGIFDFIAKNGEAYHIDAERLGVYAASANVRYCMTYLMGEHASKGIRAAALYYGWPPAGPYRKDLPVLNVVAESDAGPGVYDQLWKDVLANHAPWTIKMASNLPHAFDAFSDNDESRRVIQETISFWKNYLDPVPAPSWKHSKGRDIIALLYANNHEKALPMLKSMAVEYPTDVQTLSTYAFELTRANQSAEAEQVYKKLLNLDPQNINAMANLIAVYYRQNKTTEAEQQLSVAIESGKMDAGAYSNLGFTCLVVGKDIEAAKYFEIAVSMKPSGWDYYNLGCAYSKSNNPDKAFAALEKSIEYGNNLRSQFENDSDLFPLKADGRFKALLEKTK